MVSGTHIAAAARHILAAAALLYLGAPAFAGTVFTLQRSTNPAEYRVDQALSVTLTITLDTDSQVNSIGVEETVPEGWTFQGVTSGITPVVQPQVGTSGLLEFAWFPLPPLPTFSFTYTLAIDPGTIGTQDISGRAIAFVNQQETTSPVSTSKVVRSGSGTPHNSDRNSNFIFSLSELLRVVQFFALGGYRCAPIQVQTEDGLFAGTDAGNTNCAAIDADFESGGDYTISLAELLRVVQLYNAGTYYFCQQGEDSFCAGPPA